MNYFSQAIAWIADPANASGPNGVWARSWEHLWYTILAVVLASAIAIPLGYLVGHTGRGRGLVVASSGAARALPTLGVVLRAQPAGDRHGDREANREHQGGHDPRTRRESIEGRRHGPGSRAVRLRTVTAGSAESAVRRARFRHRVTCAAAALRSPAG